MLAYAGVYLSEPDGTEAGAWAQEVHDPATLFPLAQRFWPGSLSNGPLLDQTSFPYRPVTIGSWYWPWGASRFSQAHYVVSEEQLTRIRQAVYYPDNKDKPAVLLVHDGQNSQSALMWMLPARPLSTAVPGAGLYLLTLVDERYYWWERELNLTVTAGTTTWLDLYSAIGSALGVSISVDPIPGAYGTPTVDYAARYRLVPHVLDAVAFSIGQRVVRDYSGTVKAQNYASAKAQVSANVARNYRAFAGGQFALVPG